MSIEIHSIDEYYGLPQFEKLHEFFEYYLCKMLINAHIQGEKPICVTDLNTAVFGIVFADDYIYQCIFHPNSSEIRVKNKSDNIEESFTVLIPSIPEFCWDVIHMKLPEWNEIAFQLCDYIIGFYCDGFKNQKVHDHQIYFDLDDSVDPTITVDILPEITYEGCGIHLFIEAIKFGEKIKR